MKKIFKIWTEDCKKDTDDKYCYLRLDQTNSTQGIAIIACDKNGVQIDNGAILVLDSELRAVVTFDMLSEEIPLKTDITDTPLVYPERHARELLRPNFKITNPDIMQKIMEHFSDEKPKAKTIN